MSQLMNNREESNSDSNSGDDSSSSENFSRGRNRRSMYYDPYNANFDRESDEDFIVDSSPENRRTTRRTIRRQPYYQDRNERNEEEKKTHQSNERQMRRLNRRRLRGEVDYNENNSNSDQNEEEEDYRINDIAEEGHGSEEEDEEEFTSEIETKRTPVRNHNFYSNRVGNDESEEEIVFEKKNENSRKLSVNQNTSLEERIVVVEETKTVGIPGFSSLLHKNNDEDFKFEMQLDEDGYKIDIEEALKYKDQDKSMLD